MPQMPTDLAVFTVNMGHRLAYLLSGTFRIPFKVGSD